MIYHTHFTSLLSLLYEATSLLREPVHRDLDTAFLEEGDITTFTLEIQTSDILRI